MSRKSSSCLFSLLFILRLVVLAYGRKQGIATDEAEKPCCCCKESSNKEAHPTKQEKARSSRSYPSATASVQKDNVGSKPPSCFNKCASCSPCQLVKAASKLDEQQQGVGRVYTMKNIGSSPPSCSNKCNSCVPCRAVQAPMKTTNDDSPTDASSIDASSSTSTSSLGEDVVEESEDRHYTVGFSNYMPETWKCKCGNQFFSP